MCHICYCVFKRLKEVFMKTKNKIKLAYPAIVTECSGGTYTVSIPQLSIEKSGRTLIDAIESATEHAYANVCNRYLAPAPDAISSLNVPDGSFSTLIVLDVSSYKEAHDKRTVKRCVTIPAWLDTYGKDRCINFSSVLKDALIAIMKEDFDRKY